MRTFTSAALVCVFVVLGGLALAAHTTAHTLLSPERATRSASTAVDALADSGVRGSVMDKAVADSDLRGRLDAELATNPELEGELAALFATSKRVDVGTAQRKVAKALRQAGYPDLAREVRTQNIAAPGETLDIGELKATAAATTRAWRSKLTGFAAPAALLATACAAGGVAAAHARRNVARGILNTAIVTVGGTIATFLAVPALMGSLSQAQWWTTFADAARDAGDEVAAPLLPVLLVAVVLRIAVPLLPEGTHAVPRRHPVHAAPAPDGPRHHVPSPFGHRGRGGLPGAETNVHQADPHGSHRSIDPRHR